MSNHRTKRKRRQERQRLKYGKHAKPTHIGKSGRTGGMHKKKPKSRSDIRFGLARVLVALWDPARFQLVTKMVTVANENGAPEEAPPGKA